MKYILLLLACPAFAAQALTGFPFADETLSYAIKGPGGVGLGDARFTARRGGAGWAFELRANAGFAGFGIKDVYTSHTNSDFCSIDFTRQFEHGSHKGREEEVIDRSQEMATRTTIGGGGGRSEFPVFDCVKDALTLVYYTRREMGQGRVPPSQQFLFGGLYDISMTYTGAQTIQTSVTDKLVCTVKGPVTAFTFEIYFARDAARTPLMVSIPLAAGKITLELVH